VFPMTEVAGIAADVRGYPRRRDEGEAANFSAEIDANPPALPTTFVRGDPRCASDPERGACPRKLGNPGIVGLGRTIVGAILLWLLGIPIPIIILLLLLWH
jgi:hypothetical protein